MPECLEAETDNGTLRDVVQREPPDFVPTGKGRIRRQAPTSLWIGSDETDPIVSTAMATGRPAATTNLAFGRRSRVRQALAINTNGKILIGDFD